MSQEIPLPTKIKILLEVELGVIVTVKVFEPVTQGVDVVVLSVESVAFTTWIICPALAETPAKLKTPLPFVWRTKTSCYFKRITL